MPSWNIHIAHVERLLSMEDSHHLGIQDTNAFLFGNLVPDIYVGWMVPGIQLSDNYLENYLMTHLAGAGEIPTPDYNAFFERFALPIADNIGRISDLTIGAWAHLATDHIYNLRFTQYIEKRRLKVGSRIREKKQSDFDKYGRTLAINSIPLANESLLTQASSFPQYTITESAVRATCEKIQQVVQSNAEKHISKPVYELLNAEFFDSVSDELDLLLRKALHEYASGVSNWGRLR